MQDARKTGHRNREAWILGQSSARGKPVGWMLRENGSRQNLLLFSLDFLMAQVRLGLSMPKSI